MGKCFIIQPFDKGKFDKRFNDIFKPAIEEAGLEPYRVDMDIDSVIPIEDINKGIKEAEICLVDITIDNPNIWFELGLAIAYKKDTILICSNERKDKFPFDIQHRKIIKYSNESLSDFDNLKTEIKNRILAYKKRNDEIGQIKKNVDIETHGLEPIEIITLATIAEEIEKPGDGLSTYLIKTSNEKAGYTKLATTLALKKLLNINYLGYTSEVDFNGEEYTVYIITDEGLNWLLENKEKLILEKDNDYSEFKDDIPF